MCSWHSTHKQAPLCPLLLKFIQMEVFHSKAVTQGHAAGRRSSPPLHITELVSQQPLGASRKLWKTHHSRANWQDDFSFCQMVRLTGWLQRWHSRDHRKASRSHSFYRDPRKYKHKRLSNHHNLQVQTVRLSDASVVNMITRDTSLRHGFYLSSGACSKCPKCQSHLRFSIKG